MIKLTGQEIWVCRTSERMCACDRNHTRDWTGKTVMTAAGNKQEIILVSPLEHSQPIAEHQITHRAEVHPKSTRTINPLTPS